MQTWILGGGLLFTIGLAIALIWIYEKSTKKAKDLGRQEALGEVHEIYDKKMQEYHERERGISAKYLAARDLLRRAKASRSNAAKASKAKSNK